ncbi:hypothetical protein HDV01_004818 [Terramyces sp. JEL0728]|nr:hypothetical protein HDV01_004818 [Terramyces sp. JEL0728]
MGDDLESTDIFKSYQARKLNLINLENLAQCFQNYEIVGYRIILHDAAKNWRKMEQPHELYEYYWEEMLKLPFTFDYEGLVLLIDILKFIKINVNEAWLARLYSILDRVVALFTCLDINIRRRSFQIVQLMLDMKPMKLEIVIDALFKYNENLSSWWESIRDENTTEFCGMGSSVNDKHSFQLAVAIALDIHYLVSTSQSPFQQQMNGLQLLYPATDLNEFILQLFGDHDSLLISVLQKLADIYPHQNCLNYDIHPVKQYLYLLDHFDFDSTIILDLLMDLNSTFVHYLVTILSFDPHEIKIICAEFDSINSETDHYGSLVSTLQELNLGFVEEETRKSLQLLMNKLY